MKFSNMDESIVRTPCRFCRGQCSLKLHIKEKRIVRVEADRNDPMSHGYICPKGKAIPEILNAPDRLMHPLRRDGNNWKRISWQEAIGEIADKLKTIKKEDGAHATIIHMGQEGVIQDIEPLIQRFCNVYGTPNFSSASSQCYWAKEIGNVLTCGSFPEPDLENANCIMVWGSNPGSSNPLRARSILKKQNHGTGLVVIDPAATAIAKKADIHLQIRPGTDGALALGMLNIILSKNLYDREFVEKWTIGFDEIKALCAEFPPEKAQEITWIPAALIEQAAMLYAKTKPGCIIQGNALELHTNAVQSIRAIAVLEAVTGNLDIKGGALMNRPAYINDITLKELLPPDPKALGSSDYPLFYEFTRNAQVNMLAETILTDIPYPIKAMIIAGANPLLTFPNIKKMEKALNNLDFIVVMDMFMTKTAKLAHIVLPAATIFERSELWGIAQFQSNKKIVFADKVAEAPQECWPDWKFWFELAKAMGYHKYFPWDDIEQLYEFRLKSKGIKIDKLRKSSRNTIILGSKEYYKYKNNGFQTPSGKVEIYSERMKDIGVDPLPVYKEPAESPVKKGVLVDHYPLVLTTGARIPEYIHSRFRNIPSLNEKVPEPWVEIHPETAMSLDVEDGDKVTVESDRGSIKLKAKVTGKINPRVVRILHGWDEANANILTDDTALDHISGFPPFRSLQCRVKGNN
ncbi:MAG: molybdopterin-dependent oxidoreductase [Desulfobacula sp.]|nr:molybdopterin-dependent oxidoreductase [Desulfobacula sp.]